MVLLVPLVLGAPWPPAVPAPAQFMEALQPFWRYRCSFIAVRLHGKAAHLLCSALWVSHHTNITAGGGAPTLKTRPRLALVGAGLRLLRRWRDLAPSELSLSPVFGLAIGPHVDTHVKPSVLGLT